MAEMEEMVNLSWLQDYRRHMLAGKLLTIGQIEGTDGGPYRNSKANYQMGAIA